MEKVFRRGTAWRRIMAVLIIDARVKKEVARLIEAAQRRPVLWEQMKDAVFPVHETRNLKLSDRKPGAERPPSDHIFIGNCRVAFSFEQQPAGMFRHLSVSVPRPGRLPAEAIVLEIMELFGFDRDRRLHIWMEEFDPGHEAVNVLQSTGDTVEGHA
jgi:hypothetical protein